jgi:hypothetical protein
MPAARAVGTMPEARWSSRVAPALHADHARAADEPIPQKGPKLDRFKSVLSRMLELASRELRRSSGRQVARRSRPDRG